MAEKKPQRIAKEKQVERIREKMRSSLSTILSDYRGLTVEEMSDLRKKLRGEGIEYEVLKNSLVRLAVKDEKYEEELSLHLKGPTAIAFGYQDSLAGVRILTSFSREHENLRIKVGIMEGRLINKERLRELALLPPYDGLLTQATFVIKFPLQGLVKVLKGNMRNLVFILKNIGAKKEGTTESTEEASNQ